MVPRFINCHSCSRHFNTNITEDFVCCLCKAINQCTSDIERDVFKDSEQCRICGNYFKSGRFTGPICDRCVGLAIDEQWSLNDIPGAIRIAPGFDEKFRKIREAMMLPPIALSPAATAATRVLVSARAHQNNASTFRLGKTATFSSSSNNSKVPGILKERQQARTATHQGDHLIAVIASLWRVEGSSKARQVTDACAKYRFQETESCGRAVSHLFDTIKESLSRETRTDFGFLGKCLQLADITIHALVGKTHYILVWDAFEEKPLSDLFTHFKRHQYLSGNNEKSRTMTLALKFDGQFDEEYEALLKSTSITSSRSSRRLGQSVVPQKRGATESTSQTPPPRLPSLSAHLFLQSTSAPLIFSRNPPHVQVFFYRITIRVTEDFGVSFDKDELLDEEPILLASGVSSQKPELTGSNGHNRVILQSSGWIGEGETKLARYCRLKNLEYAFSQVHPWAKFGEVFTNEENTRMIQHEVGLHHLAIEVKKVFDKTLIERGARGMPGVDHRWSEFYFAPNVIYGQVDRTKLKDEADVPFDVFVAYPLLPTAPDGGRLCKFTGSDSLGDQPSPGDLLTLLVHSFAHFSLHYTQGTLVFTDLQGLRDKTGKMCLFDVQAHTTRDGFNEFFNRGNIGIKNFLKEHDPMCLNNPFCQKLGLCPGCVDDRQEGN